MQKPQDFRPHPHTVSFVLPCITHHRFCQQCSRIQPIDDFDASRRSCRASLAAHCERRRIRAARATDGSIHGSLSQATGSTCASEDEAGSILEAAQQADNTQQHHQQGAGVGAGAVTGGAGVLSPDAEEEQWMLPLHMPPLHQVLSLPQSPPSLHVNSTQQQQQQQQQQGCRGSSPLNTATTAAQQQHTLAAGRVADALLAAMGAEMRRPPGFNLDALLEDQQRELNGGITAQQLERALALQQEQRGAKRSRAAAGQDSIGLDDISALQGLVATKAAAGGPQHSSLSLLLQQQQRGLSPQPQMSNGLASAAQQQQLLYAQLRQQQSPPPPHLVQSAGGELLGDALLANLGIRLDSSGTPNDGFASQQLPASSSGGGSSRGDTVQRLVAVLRNLPPSGVPLLQQVVRHQHQQQLVSQQPAGPPLPAAAAAEVQPNVPASTRASSPFAAAACVGVAPSGATAREPGTARNSPRHDSSGSSDMCGGSSTALQRLTAVLKALPAGSLPLLKTALHHAEQTQQQTYLTNALDKQPSVTSACGGGSFSGSVQPPATAAVLAQGRQLPAQHHALIGGTSATLEQLLLQQQLRLFDAAPVQPLPAVVSAPDGRSSKRCAQASTAGAAHVVPAATAGLLDGLLLGNGAGGMAGMGGGAQPLRSAAAPATAPLLLEQLFAPRLSGLGMQQR